MSEDTLAPHHNFGPSVRIGRPNGPNMVGGASSCSATAFFESNLETHDQGSTDHGAHKTTASSLNRQATTRVPTMHFY